MHKIKKILVLFIFLCWSGHSDSYAGRAKVLVAPFSGVIGPVSAEFFGSVLRKAASDDFKAVVLQLDTPGGLDGSMRDTVKAIMASKIPVILYVAPSGARAASAGVFMAMASHVIAMAPGTNIGAAHPVMIGGGIGIGGGKDGKKTEKDPMEDKILNDSAAYIKSIAQERERDVAWAVKAVTESVSISAEEALKLKIADYISADIGTLLKQVDGRIVKGFEALETADAEIVYVYPSKRQKLLSAIADPNVAMILMSLGGAGLFIELYSPGLILPGVVGAVSIVLAFYAFHTLSASIAGIALIVLSFIFFIAEIKVISYGLLTVGGVISFVLGALMLFTPASGLSVSYQIIGSTLLSVMAVMLGTGFVVLKSLRQKVSTGAEAMIGRTGIARTPVGGAGKVFLDGELWDAVSAGGQIAENSRVVVLAVEGLRLKVKGTV